MVKVWNGYGSEHSANLVLIGRFKTAQDAETLQQIMEELTESAQADYENGDVDPWEKTDRYSELTQKKLDSLSAYNLSPAEFADFAFIQAFFDRKESTLTLRTDNDTLGGLIKLMVKFGARVEVYSADYYTDKI